MRISDWSSDVCSSDLHTNVLGTRNVADACRRAEVAAMVLVSTDEAVNPPNVMGASKRLAECYCQAPDLLRQSTGSGTRFVTVRFGNVLGSTASVVPLFPRQLAAAAPPTVPTLELSRSSMTLPAALCPWLTRPALCPPRP